MLTASFIILGHPYPSKTDGDPTDPDDPNDPKDPKQQDPADSIY